MRGSTFLPQIAARAGDSVFGAKIPLPAFFMAAAFFAPAAFFSLLTYQDRGSAGLQRGAQMIEIAFTRSNARYTNPAILCDWKLQQKKAPRSRASPSSSAPSSSSRSSSQPCARPEHVRRDVKTRSHDPPASSETMPLVSRKPQNKFRATHASLRAFDCQNLSGFHDNLSISRHDCQNLREISRIPLKFMNICENLAEKVGASRYAEI